MWYITSHAKFHVWQNSRSLVSAQDALDQSDCGGFLKFQYLKNQMWFKDDCFVKELQIYWAWSCLVRHSQTNLKVYMRNILKRQIWSGFLCILSAHKHRVLWNQCRLLVSHWFSQSVQHFSESLISFLKSLVIFKTVRKEYYWDTWLPIPNSMTDKILVFELKPQLLSTNQIPRLPKLLYLENELKHKSEFLYGCDKSIRLGLP